MKGMGTFLCVFMVLIGVSFAQAPRHSSARTTSESPAHSELVDMHDGTIYDIDTQLSWLKDAGAGGEKTYDQAVAWVASLNAGSGFAGLTGWRLPNADPSCGDENECRKSEMGHLFFGELGNIGNNNGQPDRATFNTGPFTNLEWGRNAGADSTCLGPLDRIHAEIASFDFWFGIQRLHGDPEYRYWHAWPVRPGARPTRSK